MKNWKKSNYWLCTPVSPSVFSTFVTLISSSFSSSVFTLLNWNGMWELTNYKLRSHAHVRYPHNWCSTFYLLIIVYEYIGTKKKSKVLSSDSRLFSRFCLLLIKKFCQIWNKMFFENSIAKTSKMEQKSQFWLGQYWLIIEYCN